MNLIRFPVVEYRPAFRDVPVAADTLVPFGVMVALNKSGHALPVADAAGLATLGSAFGPAEGPSRRNVDTDNRGNAAGVKVVHVQTGLLRYLNSSGHPVTAAELGKVVFVEDERTVARASGHRIRAGVAVGLVGSVYVWIFCGQAETVPGSAVLGSV